MINSLPSYIKYVIKHTQLIDIAINFIFYIVLEKLLDVHFLDMSRTACYFITSICDMKHPMVELFDYFDRSTKSERKYSYPSEYTYEELLMYKHLSVSC